MDDGPSGAVDDVGVAIPLPQQFFDATFVVEADGEHERRSAARIRLLDVFVGGRQKRRQRLHVVIPNGSGKYTGGSLKRVLQIQGKSK